MPNGNKAGLAGGTLFDQFQNHIGWWYDWTPNTLWHSGRPVAVPMLWGSGQRGDLQNDWSRWDTWMQLFSPWGSAATPQYMLGFNEPDCSSEASSNIDPYYAASLWNQYFAPLGAKGTVLVSPAMCMQDSETWLQPFRSAISTDFDVVSVHIYQGNLADVQRVVNHYRQYGKPLWITEFGCVNNPSSGFNGCTDQGQINSFIWQVVQWFEEQGDIMAYSPADVWGSNWVLNYGTWATETGNQYLSAVQHFHP
jgi:hypothetical protein